MKTMDKKINFKSRNKIEFEVQPKPYPAIKSLPKWFLNSDPYEKSNTNTFPNDGNVHVRNKASNAAFKKCVPMLDGMGSGYIIPLWADVEVESSENGPSIFWRTESGVFTMHGTDTKKITPPIGYYDQVFKYQNTWIPETPKGYSCIITSPYGHNDLPIKAITGIIDSDKTILELILPVWIKENFNGIIEKGTPIAQVIPFKRDNWTSTFSHYDGEEYFITKEKGFNSTIVGHYLKNNWSKKKYK
jgi:hypothetical protein